MFTQLNMYKNLILGGVVIVLLAGLYFYIHSLKVQIDTLQDNLKDSYVEAANLKLQSERYRNALDAQNKEIEEARVDKQLAIKKLSEWNAKPAEVRYKVIYKIREVKSNDCEDIKTQLDSIRHLDYEQL